MTQCEAKYKIQVGSWTKLPDGKVQEDTRAIMEMMAEKVGGEVEKYNPPIGFMCKHVGIASVDKVILFDVGDFVDVFEDTNLLIPYNELQKMLNQKATPEPNRATSLLNTKLDCRKPDGSVDVELSKAFQEVVTGGEHTLYAGWMVHSKREAEEVFTSAPFLYVKESGVLSLGEDEKYFNNQTNYKQIDFTYSRKLEWEATVIEPATPEPVDEMVSICGVEYSAKELKEALELIGKAKK